MLVVAMDGVHRLLAMSLAGQEGERGSVPFPAVRARHVSSACMQPVVVASPRVGGVLCSHGCTCHSITTQIQVNTRVPPRGGHASTEEAWAGWAGIDDFCLALVSSTMVVSMKLRTSVYIHTITSEPVHTYALQYIGSTREGGHRPVRRAREWW